MRSTAHFVPVHNELRHREPLGANCGRFALLPGGVTGLSAAEAAVPVKGMGPLTATLCSSPLGRGPRPVAEVTATATATATGKIIYGMNGLTVRPGTELAAIAAPHD